MKRTGKEWALRIGILLSGLTVAHLGVTLFLLSDLNSDPFNLFVQGISRIPCGRSFCFLTVSRFPRPTGRCGGGSGGR